MKRIKEKAKKAFIPHNENEFLPSVLKPRTLFILAVVLLIIKFLIFSWFVYFPKTDQFAIITSSYLVELANQERVNSGLQPLKINQKLVQAAQQKANDMLNKNYFNHISPTGISPWYWLDVSGYKYAVAGENLAKDFTDGQPLHQAWMNSSSHKANILNNKYQEIGIAVIEGEINGKKTVLAVQFFGSSFAQTSIIPTQEKLLVESDTEIELTSFTEAVEVEGEETTLLRGPEIFEQTRNVLSIITNKSESFTQGFYFIILGLLVLVLLLTIFVNIRVQYPRAIFIALIFIVLIAAIALFNGQEFLNKGLEVLCVSL